MLFLPAHAFSYYRSLYLPQQPLSAIMSTPEPNTTATSLPVPDRPSQANTKPQRVLACVVCQKRKVKCDRRVPCTNCIRSQTQCVPAATLVPRQRRRRFPERELLDRLRHYESLLRHSNIKFEPLHKDHLTTEKKSLNPDSEGRGYDSQDDEQLVTAVGADQSSSHSMAIKSEKVYEAKYALALQESYLPRLPITFFQEHLARFDSKGTSTFANVSEPN